HDFVLSSTTAGPNVFLQGTAEKAHADIGPHHRWSSGTMFDTIVSDHDIDVQNRGNSGSGHGWAGANMVFWNNTAGRIMNIQDPPGAHNWAIGCSADRLGGRGRLRPHGTKGSPHNLL